MAKNHLSKAKMLSNWSAVLRYLTVEALVCLSSHLQSWAMTYPRRRNRSYFSTAHTWLSSSQTEAGSLQASQDG